MRRTCDRRVDCEDVDTALGLTWVFAREARGKYLVCSCLAWRLDALAVPKIWDEDSLAIPRHFQLMY